MKIKLVRKLENENLKKILYEIDSFTWSKRGWNLHKLDSLIFNEIYDEIKAIVSKEKYDDKDVVDLKRIAKRLDQEVKNLEAKPPSS